MKSSPGPSVSSIEKPEKAVTSLEVDQRPSEHGIHDQPSVKGSHCLTQPTRQKSNQNVTDRPAIKSMEAPVIVSTSSTNRVRVWRVEEIPGGTSEESLQEMFPFEERNRIKITSLSSNVNPNRQTLTATVAFLAPPEAELRLATNSDMRIDKDFYGFTPLHTPDGHVETDIIAITGLAGHAFGSWAASQHHMWLRDFLPRDFPRARILLYGYNSQLAHSQSRSIIADFTSNFIAKFRTMRSQSRSESRPTVLIGHSLGCLIIKGALVEMGSFSFHSSRKHFSIHKRLRPTFMLTMALLAEPPPPVKCLILFGAPHRGLDVVALQTMVKGMPSEGLVQELEMRSPTLQMLNDRFRRVYEGLDILTVYEMQPTASLQESTPGCWKRTGPLVMMTEKNSALLNWPKEQTIGLHQDHSRIAKVDLGQNGCYDDIVHFIQQSFGLAQA